MISIKKVEKLIPKAKRYTIKVGNSLFLRVSPTGHKSYVLRYYCFGKVRDITLGSHPSMTPLQAQQMAHLKRDDLQLRPSKGITLAVVFKL